MVTYLTNANPLLIATGDIYDDNRKDLIVGNHDSNDISIFLGFSNESFMTQTIFPTAVEPYGVAFDDFNCDSRNLWKRNS